MSLNKLASKYNIIMTAKVLDNYFKKQLHTYEDLARSCSSVVELKFKLVIFGKSWTCWDWALFLDYLLAMHTQNDLIDDIMTCIRDEDALDGIVTNKTVLLSMTDVLKLKCKNASDETKSSLLAILKLVFKKFPDLWNMSWMHTRYKDFSDKKMKTKHKLQAYKHLILDI